MVTTVLGYTQPIYEARCGIGLIYLMLKIDLIVITVYSVLIVVIQYQVSTTIYALCSTILCMD